MRWPVFSGFFTFAMAITFLVLPGAGQTLPATTKNTILPPEYTSTFSEIRVPVHFDHVTLENALKSLAISAKVSVVVDWKALEKADVKREKNIDLNIIDPIPLRRAFQLISAQCTAPLDYYLEDGVFEVTTEEIANSEACAITRTYDVRDLLDSDESRSSEDIARELVESITSTCAPDKWRDRGGTAASIRLALGRMIITAPRSMHDAISHLLSELREPRIRRAERLPVNIATTLPESISPEETPIKSDPSATNLLANGNTKFALELLPQLKPTDGNLFYSPYSLSALLAVLHEGARGKTAEQIAKVAHFQLEAGIMRSTFAAGIKSLNGDGDDSNDAFGHVRSFQLQTSNTMFVQSGFNLNVPFMQLAADSYKATVTDLDFHEHPDNSARIINEWVAKQTHDKINGIVTPDIIKDHVIVLINTVYFKGTWSNPFETKNTGPATFARPDAIPMKVAMMHQPDVSLPYASTPDFQLLELPYNGSELSCLIFLPLDMGSLPQLEKQISPAKLRDWIAILREHRMDVYLPKFELTSQFELQDNLAAMGMKNAFSSNDADFTAIADNAPSGQRLYLDFVLHKATVKVDELGTEAAAASAAGGLFSLSSSGPTNHPILFRADHPFLFLIYHWPTSQILFMGRLNAPDEYHAPPVSK